MTARMVTRVEVDKQNKKVTVFHRNVSNKSWTHPYGENCDVCRGKSTAAPEEKSGE